MSENKIFFDDSYDKIDHAARHFKSIDDLLTSYGKEVGVQWIPMPDDPEKFVFTAVPAQPAVLPLMVADCLHCLRSALDIMMCDIGRRHNTILAEKIDFPFSSSRESLEKRLTEKKYRELPLGVVDAVFRHGPCADGSADLYGVGQFDNLSKHRLIVPTLAVGWGESGIERAVEAMNRNNPHRRIAVLGAMPTLDYIGTINSKEVIGNRTEIYYSGRPASALFPPGVPFEGQHVLEVLSRVGKLVGEVVDDFRQFIYL